MDYTVSSKGEHRLIINGLAGTDPSGPMHAKLYYLSNLPSTSVLTQEPYQSVRTCTSINHLIITRSIACPFAFYSHSWKDAVGIGRQKERKKVEAIQCRVSSHSMPSFTNSPVIFTSSRSKQSSKFLVLSSTIVQNHDLEQIKSSKEA